MKRRTACAAGTAFIFAAFFACAAAEPQPEDREVAAGQPAYSSTSRVTRTVDMPVPEFEEGYQGLGSPGEAAVAGSSPAGAEPREEAAGGGGKDGVIAGDKDAALARLPSVSEDEKNTLESLQALQAEKRAGTSAAPAPRRGAAAAPRGAATPQQTGPGQEQEDELEDLARSLEEIKERKAGRAALDQDLNEVFTTADEIELGKGVAARILDHTPEWDAPELWEYVSCVGLALAEACPRNDLTYYFVLLDSDDVNAFSTPGGFVFVTRGALRFCTNEAELASILAHEIAHIALRHAIRSLDKAKFRLMSLDALKEMDEKMERDQALEQLAEDLADVANDCYKMTQNPYNQEMENEADREALVYLAKAGYNPFAAIALMDRLVASAATDVEYAKGLSSHPNPKERAETMRAAMEKLGVRGAGKFNEQRFKSRVHGE